MEHKKIDDITILIAEDEIKLLHSMAEYLQIFFTHVHTAEDGSQAYEKYRNIQPDILIADIHMPHMDGLSLIQKIRETDRETKIIITTAHSDKEKLLQAIELNLVKYLIKPVQSDQLKTLLFSLVDEIHARSSTVSLKEGYLWNQHNGRLFSPEGEVTLSYKEKKALALLIEKRGSSVSSFDIYNHLYEDQPERDYSAYAVTSLIKRLRQKLPAGMIKSIYGVGYLFLAK